MNDVHALNLARKWRSSNFDQIVGQDLSIRMLKNSLYAGHIFPVYLFAGQRGCGKTSTARIFAAALNCYNLSLFRKVPKDTALPCLSCDSCQAMQKNSHPDFIEIDAASHTGVDNVRSLIEASTLMPLMGEKKIYLIDEAHMLSKAAFNAFLKLLEEPPASVVFILATTDSEKIIETVRSRCFQLFFKPIKNDQLIAHLQTVCLAEMINHDRAGLEMIVKETQGSARDALNLLEQVRFAYSSVTAVSVSQVLGHVDDRALLNLVDALLCSNSRAVMHALQKISYEDSSLDFIWHRLIELVRTVLWNKYGINKGALTAYEADITALAQRCSSSLLQSFLLMMHKEYATFVRTTAQETFFEMICLKFSRSQDDSDDSSGSSGMSGHLQSAPAARVPMDEDENQDDEDEENDQDNDDDTLDSWAQFIDRSAAEITNPLLLSVLQRGTLQQSVDNNQEVTLVFPKDMQFFSHVLTTHAADLQLLLNKACGRAVQFKTVFSLQPLREIPLTPVKDSAHPERPSVSEGAHLSERGSLEKRTTGATQGDRQQAHSSSYFREKKTTTESQKNRYREGQSNELSIDISDKNSWKKAHLLLEFFPGHITEIREYTNEQQQA